MRQGRVRNLTRLSALPDQDPGTHPVIKVTTDWREDQQNSFYIDIVDKEGNPVDIATTTEGTPNNPNVINWEDEIIFDKQDGLMKKCAIWRGRKFRQRGYSFDGR